MLENVWEFLQCEKKLEQREEMKINFINYIWFRGEEKLIFKVFSVKLKKME